MAKRKKYEHSVLVPVLMKDGRWKVSLGAPTIEGKKTNPRRYFATKAEAQDFCNAEREKRRPTVALDGWLGVSAEMKSSGLDPIIVTRNWIDLDRALKKVGKKDGLFEIGMRHLATLQAISKTGTVEECLAKFLEHAMSIPLSPVYISDIQNRGRRFVTWYGKANSLADVTVETMQSYFASISDKAGSNWRTVSAWMGWAVGEGWLATNPCVRNRRKGTKKKAAREAVIMSPPEVEKILKLAVDAEEWVILGFLVISLFGGVRPMEFEKLAPSQVDEVKRADGRRKPRSLIRWTWENIRMENMVMPPNLGKRGARIIPINNTLAAWIQFLRAKRGNLTGPILAAGTRGGWRKPWDNFRSKYWVDQEHRKIDWHDDQLRHSYGSYRLAQIKNPSEVAMEMGNSAEILLKYYWHWETLAEDAEQFWELTPEKILKDH